MKLVATVLGSGSSGGVPRIGNHWGACDPKEPKNRRRRCSLLIEQFDPAEPHHKTSVLIDTSPDMREQLLDAEVDWVDGVLYTHDHADQSHGIDDLRMLAINRRRRVDVWMDEPTSKSLIARFGYCFIQPPDSGYPPILSEHRIEGPGAAIRVEGAGGPMDIMPFDVDHGSIRALGFRVGPLAYCADCVDVPDESFRLLDGIESWIVDALRYTPHPTHAHVDLALEWLKRAGVVHGILTNLHVDLDYRTLKTELPEGVEPAYDGMRVEFDIST